MKTIVKIIAGAAAFGTLATAAHAERPSLAERGEQRLAKMLEGRTAGEPVNCISAPRGNRLQVIDRVGVVYDAGDTVYVARVSNPRTLNGTDALIIDRFGSQLCTTDMTRTFDRFAGNMTGVVFFDNFVPYREG